MPKLAKKAAKPKVSKKTKEPEALPLGSCALEAGELDENKV